MLEGQSCLAAEVNSNSYMYSNTTLAKPLSLLDYVQFAGGPESPTDCELDITSSERQAQDKVVIQIKLVPFQLGKCCWSQFVAV